MGWLANNFGRKAAQLTYDQVANLIDGVGGGRVAGMSVTDKTALQVATVLACVKTIADGCATPKLNVFRELPDGTRQKAVNIPEFRLLARRPNEWQTSYEWRRQMTLHAALTGAALSIKVKGENRRTRELIPVMPGSWDVRRVSRYELRYRCWDEFGLIGEFAPADVFVLHGVQWDWTRGLNAVKLAANAIGLAMATENSHAKMHENGIRTSGAYSVDAALTEEQHDRLQKTIKRLYAGSENAGVPMILDRSAKWVSSQMSGSDAQHVELRRLQIEEICRGYSVFPIMVGHSDKSSTFASSEAFFAAHVKHTLAPWHAAWTQRFDEMLLDGSGPLYAEFDTRYLTAGSMRDRAAWARTMAEMGIYTRNELRDEEGRDPLAGLDDPLTPMNMTGADDETATKPPADAPADEKARARIEVIEARMNTLADKQPQQAVGDQLQRRFDAIDRRLDMLCTVSQQPPTMHLELNTKGLEDGVQGALGHVTEAFIERIKSTPNADMPITINVPPQPAPIVHVNVPETVVHVEAVLQPSPVVINGPVKSEQRVNRDPKTDEITGTVTTHTY